MSIRDTPEFDNDLHPTEKAGALGLWLFLAALFMLFFSSLMGYALIRLQALNRIGWGVIHLPRLLWLSTALMLAASLALQSALTRIRHNHLRQFKFSLLAAMAFAIAFVAVQTPALIQLLDAHGQFRHRGIAIYGLIFCLILLHALHVVGGLIALARIIIRGLRNAYTAAHFAPVRYTALYWHFLDAVWLIMFSTLWLLR